MAKSLSQENRREFPRFNLELKGGYRVHDLVRKEGFAEIQNLSHGGLMFISSSVLKQGDSLIMSIYYLEIEIVFNAKVIWKEKLPGTFPMEFKYGLKNIEISPFDNHYISRIIHNL